MWHGLDTVHGHWVGRKLLHHSTARKINISALPPWPWARKGDDRPWKGLNQPRKGLIFQEGFHHDFLWKFGAQAPVCEAPFGFSKNSFWGVPTNRSERGQNTDFLYVWPISDLFCGHPQNLFLAYFWATLILGAVPGSARHNSRIPLDSFSDSAFCLTASWLGYVPLAFSVPVCWTKFPKIRISQKCLSKSAFQVSHWYRPLFSSQGPTLHTVGTLWKALFWIPRGWQHAFCEVPLVHKNGCNKLKWHAQGTGLKGTFRWKARLRINEKKTQNSKWSFRNGSRNLPETRPENYCACLAGRKVFASNFTRFSHQRFQISYQISEENFIAHRSAERGVVLIRGCFQNSWFSWFLKMKNFCY